MATELCARCARSIGEAQAEHCWVCESPLCTDPCWEEFGVCAASACCELQTELLKATTDAQRHEIMSRPGPIGATKNRRQEH